ncbi:MAG TPA: hypothetical protein VIN08_20410 [Ohtaekwangia sp.]|uniref:hypothetical protein n=1 Tax=Ohtaekwangia sp. TaxID=2066019 RepID=UPI002F91F7BC
MQKEYEFDEAFRRDGGRAKSEIDLFTDIRRRFSAVNTFLKHSYPNLPEIHLDFIENDSLNAAATKYKGNYFIGINLGSYFLIYDMFMKMLASKSVWPKIGNNQLETDHKKILKAYINIYDKITFRFDNQDIAIPQDKLRLEFAILCTNHAFDFLIYHEIAHILRGHVGYLASLIENNFYWREFDNLSQRSKLPSDVSQTLEMDADSFATNRSLNIIASNLKDTKQVNEIFRFAFKDWSTILPIWVFSIYSLFRLFGYRQYAVEDAKKLSHPPSSIRMALIAGNIVTLFELKYGKELIPSVVKDIIESTKAAEDAFSEITFQEANWDIYRNSYTKESTDYIFSITDNWNKVRPVLEEYALGNLPPLKIIK